MSNPFWDLSLQVGLLLHWHSNELPTSLPWLQGDLREMFNEPNTEKHQEDTWLQGKEFGKKKQHWQPRSIKHLLKSKMMAHNMGNGESFCHSFRPCFLGPPYLSHHCKKLCKIGTPKQSPTQSTCLYSSSADHAKTKLKTAAEAEKCCFGQNFGPSRVWPHASSMWSGKSHT